MATKRKRYTSYPDLIIIQHIHVSKLHMVFHKYGQLLTESKNVKPQFAEILFFDTRNPLSVTFWKKFYLKDSPEEAFTGRCLMRGTLLENHPRAKLLDTRCCCPVGVLGAEEAARIREAQSLKWNPFFLQCASSPFYQQSLTLCSWQKQCV